MDTLVDQLCCECARPLLEDPSSIPGDDMCRVCRDRQPEELVSVLDQKIQDAWRILDESLAVHLDSHELVARCVLFSGGNDSTVLAHLMRSYATHAVHVNTTIGIERTRQYVRETSMAFGLPLIEETPPETYLELVRQDGRPGPAKHWKMYQRLKERALRKVRRRFVKNGRRQRILFIAGRRRQESGRRTNIVEHERVFSVIWASPLANWTSEDMVEYRDRYMADVPPNPVSEQLGMSGECLCGAFAEPGEFERIQAVDPDAAELILEVERAARDAGHPEQLCQWGWGAYRDDPDRQPAKVGRLCSSCDARWAPVKDEEPSPELAAVLARRHGRELARTAYDE